MSCEHGNGSGIRLRLVIEWSLGSSAFRHVRTPSDRAEGVMDRVRRVWHDI
jgi:hypothetical protein